MEAHAILLSAKLHLLPESYLYGLADVRSMANGMHSFILGRVWEHGVWFYLPCVFLIKSTPGFAILALALSAIVSGQVHRPRETLFLGVPAVFYLFVAMGSSLNTRLAPYFTCPSVLLRTRSRGNSALMHGYKSTRTELYTSWAILVGCLLAAHVVSSSVAAREIQDLAPGASVELDANEVASPAAFSTLKPGDYEIQAVLDVNHTYTYSGRGPSDWLSPVAPLPAWTPGSNELVLTLDYHPQENERYAAETKAAHNAATSDVAVHEAFPSALLTQFWGRPISIDAWVILPPGYTASSHESHPTAYWAAGFGGNLEYALISA